MQISEKKQQTEKNIQINLHIWNFIRTFALAFENRHLFYRRLHRGVEQLVARQAHNLEVTRSSRVSATKQTGIPFGIPIFLDL